MDAESPPPRHCCCSEGKCWRKNKKKNKHRAVLKRVLNRSETRLVGIILAASTEIVFSVYFYSITHDFFQISLLAERIPDCSLACPLCVCPMDAARLSRAVCMLGACGSMELPALLQCSGTAAALLQVTLEIPLPPAGPAAEQCQAQCCLYPFSSGPVVQPHGSGHWECCQLVLEGKYLPCHVSTRLTAQPNTEFSTLSLLHVYYHLKLKTTCKCLK